MAAYESPVTRGSLLVSITGDGRWTERGFKVRTHLPHELVLQLDPPKGCYQLLTASVEGIS